MLLLNTDNFVPVTRTPWAGNLIPRLKASGLGLPIEDFAARIGESWEVSTEPSFVSKVVSESNKLLTQVLEENAESILGKEVSSVFKGHCPLLLKWLHAQDTLSVQLHPNNSNSKLKADECGKPESWLVLDAAPGSFVYLGFQANVSKEMAMDALLNGRPETVLQKYFPKKYDYISVPTGLVHATGPGVLIAEPQYVLPAKKGKTWRLSDWGRKYDSQGELSATGSPRELHIEDGFSAIDWNYPQGDACVRCFVSNCAEAHAFRGTAQNPFALQLFIKEGKEMYDPLVPASFSLATCFGGEATVHSMLHGTQTLKCGQSAIVCASEGSLQLELKSTASAPGLAIFALQHKLVD